MARTLHGAATALQAIEYVAGAGLGAQELLEEVAARIDRVVPSDGYFLAATDPETTLCIGAGIVHELPHDLCRPTWDYEFLVPDYLKFTDVVRSGRDVGDLHEATGGFPDRSPRWREFGGTTGFRAELRTTFTLSGAAWGIGQFDRLGDASRYSDAEKDWLAQVAPVVATGLRNSLLAQPAVVPATRGPGVVVLDIEGRVLSASREAQEWLDEVGPAFAGAGGGEFPLPLEAHAYVSRLRASREAHRVEAARLRTRGGVWLLMHGSLLDGVEQLALMIEPARAADVAPLIVEAYGLSRRELEVARAIARGNGTSEIAAELFLSPHTVRDHVKALFEKVGVSSRGELVAKMFAEHYQPPSRHTSDPAAAG
jgi:DNA-binding CsgD family transcriptional regulator